MKEAPLDAADMVRWEIKRCNTQARQAAWRVGLGSGVRARPGYARGQKRAREKGRVWGGSLTSRQVVVITGQGTAGRRVTTLADLISSSGAEGLWNHQQFAAVGVPPPMLTCKKVMAFVPHQQFADAFLRLVKHVQVGSKLGFMWAVTMKGNKILPFGLALVSQRQIMAKAEGTNA